MSSTFDAAKEVSRDLSEVIKERLFSPMYFYFTLSWIITNWKFVFSLFALDQKYLWVLKVDYLASFYQFDSLYTSAVSFSKLLLIPAFFAWFAVWCLSVISEQFYRKTYQSKVNKESIKRKIDYAVRVQISSEQRRIRDIESDKKSMRYEDYTEFNEYIDDGYQEGILIGDTVLQASEALYNTDYQAYVDLYDDFLNASTDHLEYSREKIMRDHVDEVRAQTEREELR